MSMNLWEFFLSSISALAHFSFTYYFLVFYIKIRVFHLLKNTFLVCDNIQQQSHLSYHNIVKKNALIFDP